MRRSLLGLAVSALAVLAPSALATAPDGNVLPALPGSVSAEDTAATSAVYQTYDGALRPARSRSWRLTKAGGNCCETRVAATSSGRLLEFGGTNLLYSDNEGESWQKVTPVTPLVGGEGDIIAAPGGDVVAIGWDVYSGDHLQAYKYTAATKQWDVAEITLRTPVYDRPWITLVKGPITLGLTTYPYAVELQGGVGVFSNVQYISGDGLHYTELAIPRTDDRLASSNAPYTATKDPAADYWAAADPALSTTLNGGGVIVQGGGSSCAQMRMLAPSPTLTCPKEPGMPVTLRQASTGTFVRTYTLDDGDFIVETSKDAQKSWHAVRIHPPVHGTFERFDAGNPAAAFHDMAVNGRLGFAALATRIERSTADGHRLSQDAVYVVDTTGVFPLVREVLFVGVGGLSTRGGVDPQYSGPRLDFYTVAILPNGRIATGYYDTQSGEPAIAIETGITRTYGGRVSTP